MTGDSTTARRDPEDRAGEIIAAYLEAVDQGGEPDHREFFAPYPELTPYFDAFLADHERWRRMAAPFKQARRSALNESDPQTPTRVASPHGGGPSANDVLVSGTAIGNCVLLEEVARGGMGVIYKARQQKVNRIVALKMILAGQFASRDDLLRFRAEAEAAAQLDHPNIVPVHEVGEHEGRPYFTMKWIEGGTLTQLIAQPDPLDRRVAAALMAQVARAVHYAHQHGILHRDLKPGNILLSGQGSVVSGRPGSPCAGSALPADHWPLTAGNAVPYVTDFGLAKQLDHDGNLTQSGAILGTPNYMSPEQARGNRQLTTATDIYSLGAILYELVTRQRLFPAGAPMATILQVQNAQPARPRSVDPTISRDLETICLRCLAKEPEARYASAVALAEDLERFLAGEPVLARPYSLTETTARWVRHHPAVAALSLAVTLSLISGLALVTWKWRSEIQAREDADAARDLAERSVEAERRARREADDKTQALQQALYASQIDLAQRTWSENQLVAARQNLDRCEPSLRHWEWNYLRRLCEGSRITFTGHENLVSSVSFHPKGKALASASWDGSVRIWDLTRKKPARTLHDHKGRVLCLAYSPDGKLLASADDDGKVCVRDADSDKVLLTHDKHGASVPCLAFSADSERLATGGDDKTARIWQARTGKNLHLLRHEHSVQDVAFHPDEKRLITAANQNINIWNLGEEKVSRTLKKHQFGITRVALDQAGKRLVSSSLDGTVRLWDLESGECAHTWSGPLSLLWSTAFSPDAEGKHIVAAGLNRSIMIWNSRTAEKFVTLRGHTDNVVSLAYSADGDMLASGGVDMTVRVWDPRNEPGTFSVRGGNGTEWACLPDGPRIAFADQNHQVCFWDVDSRRNAASGFGHKKNIASLAYSPDGTRLASASVDQTVKIWDPETGQIAHNFTHHKSPLAQVLWAADNRILSLSANSRLLFWDPANGRIQHDVAKVRPDVNLALGDNGRLAAGILDRSRLVVWDMSTGKEVYSRERNSTIRCLAFRPDGKQLALGHEDRTIVLLNLDGEDVAPQVLAGHTEIVLGLAWTRDGNRLASCAGDGTVRLWDPRGAREVLALRGPHNAAGPVGMSRVSFAGRDRFLVAGCQDGTIRIWDGTAIGP